MQLILLRGCLAIKKANLKELQSYINMCTDIPTQGRWGHYQAVVSHRQ